MLSNKVAIITGAGRGIGRAVSLSLARAGAKIVVIDVELSRAESVVKEIETLGGEAFPIAVDVRQEQELEEAAKKILAHFGKIDVLVNNAGITAVGKAEELCETDWNKVMDVNVKGVFLCSKVFGREMLNKKQGIVVNIASMMGTVALPTRIAYSVSKAAVIMLTKCQAVEWADRNIRVNAVAPAYVMTEKIEGLVEKNHIDLKRIEDKTPLGRLATPAEVGDVVTFLASEDSSYVTGQVLMVDGGWTSGAW